MLWLLPLLALIGFGSANSFSLLDATLNDLPNPPMVLELTRRSLSPDSPFVPQHLPPQGPIPGNQTNTQISAVLLGERLVVNVTVGWHYFNMAIDTGVADTWVIGSDFECLDPESRTQLNQGGCAFAWPYEFDPTYKAVLDKNFNIILPTGEFLSGFVGLEYVELGGVEVLNQQLAFVTYAGYKGDGYTSGVLGMAYPSATKIYNSPFSGDDGHIHPDNYNTIFWNMIAQGSVPGWFALNVNRKTGTLGNAGFLTLGADMIEADHAPSVFTAFLPAEGDTEITLYNINVEALSYGASNVNGSMISNATFFGPSPHIAYLTNSSAFTAALESNAPAFYFPETQARAINALFDPPAVYDADRQIFLVSCINQPPFLGVKISGQTFWINQIDLIEDNLDGTCLSTIRIGVPGTYALGIQFFYNTNIAFGVVSNGASITARQEYTI